MSDDFKPEPLTLIPGDFENADVEFWNVEGYPVVNIFDGKTGMVALFGETRTFPLDSVYRNGYEVSKNEFFTLFPETKIYFFTADKKAV